MAPLTDAMIFACLASLALSSRVKLSKRAATVSNGVIGQSNDYAGDHPVKGKSPTVYMMVGVPASGKSFWLKNWLGLEKSYDDGETTRYDQYVFLSSDFYVEKYAKEHNKSYSEVFEEAMKAGAYKKMLEDRDYAIKEKLDVYWDQTNLNVKVRTSRLSLFDGYRKVAVVWEPPKAEQEVREWNCRLNNRGGKIIPTNRLNNMLADFEMPTTNEGFDEIIVVPNPWQSYCQRKTKNLEARKRNSS
eukprot:gnl/MRDRNA2_/MRDRNA2_83772_c0_seq1.p1 gnl/MRDRNA2_/MRDRNA2_83772_c0~~gnl/MRDRNA2_/MRDRNA2_83772_c0_seq1.p1  ORF type:complete len:276 (+),score=36.25 gnl/MRDRNA2_/MRDRNA2_83772_c0_seq1:95-829(+)